MALPVNKSPIIAKPGRTTDPASVATYLIRLVTTLITELQEHALRLNNALVKDGTEPMLAPLILPSYLKTTLPSAATYVSALIYVSNDTGGATIAFSDGTNWRRVQDRNVIS